MLRLSQKLLLFVLGAAVIPLSLAGFWLLREAERELGTRLEREQRALASAAAEASGTQLAVSLESLAQSASLIDWPHVSVAEADCARWWWPRRWSTPRGLRWPRCSTPSKAGRV
jgi:two-component system, NtrC family, sensor kinase